MSPFRVLTGEFLHETNTFCIIPTDKSNFDRQNYFDSPEEIKKNRLHTRTAVGATYESAEKFGWDLTDTICAEANPSGKVEDGLFDSVCDIICAPLKNAKFDGILLHLHGAMVTNTHEDAEGELLKRIRNIIGFDVPVIVTLDLHGNITAAMAENASALIACRTYPHIDFYERALQGAELLQKAMSGEVVPRTVISRLPMLRGLDGGKTHDGSPMLHLIRRGEEMESSGVALVVSICSGFSASDIHDVGPSVTVTYDARSPLDSSNGMLRAQEIGKEFMQYAWETRTYQSARHLSIEQAVLRAKEAGEISKELPPSQWPKPLVMSDVTDNPGSGHYGDSTNLLKALLDAKVLNLVFYAIFDSEAVKQGLRIGVGNEGSITMGGNYDINAGGPPIEVFGRVVSITDGHFPSFGPMGNGVWQNYGLSMLFRSGGVDIIVISNNGQLYDLAQITSLGCDPLRKSTICVKSNHHFRACTTAIAREIVTVDGGGLGSIILKLGNYLNVRRPIWPLDQIEL